MGRADLELFCNPLEHLRGLGWHEVGGFDWWNVDKIVQEQGVHLVHSSLRGCEPENGNFKEFWQRMFFRPSQDLLICLYPQGSDPCYLAVWAASPITAKTEFKSWWENYRIARKRKVRPAEFKIITVQKEGISTRSVEVCKRFSIKREDLALHYGNDFPEWSEHFLHCLRTKRFGATVLRGEPGTGKTSFLRYLICKLRRTHRFFYLPTEHVRMLTDPQMVEFWASRTRLEDKMRQVMILEDAEALLMERAGDNRSVVANMLNIADGLLGEFLQVHLIFTINGKLENIDPAMKRNGRMIAYRHFRRLNRHEAEALAAAKGLTLPLQERLLPVRNLQREQPPAQPVEQRIDWVQMMFL